MTFPTSPTKGDGCPFRPQISITHLSILAQLYIGCKESDYSASRFFMMSTSVTMLKTIVATEQIILKENKNFFMAVSPPSFVYFRVIGSAEEVVDGAVEVVGDFRKVKG